MVVEIWAAVAGASVGVASAGITGINRQSQHGRDSLVRLTTAVDNLGQETKRFLLDYRILSNQWLDLRVIAIGTNVLVQFRAIQCF